MKKVYLAASLIIGIFFVVPSPPTKLSAKENGVDSLDYYRDAVIKNHEYVRQKLRESKENLHFIENNLK